MLVATLRFRGNSSRGVWLGWPLIAGGSARGRRLALRLLNDSDAGARSDSGGARRDHGLDRLEILDTARRLDTHLLADHAAHQRDIGHRRTAWPKAGRRLYEIGA